MARFEKRGVDGILEWSNGKRKNETLAIMLDEMQNIDYIL